MSLVDRMRFYNVPAVSIAVIDRFAIDWARAYGVKEAGGSEPVNIETLFQAASISKPIVALATLGLVTQGKLGLDEEVNKKLTSWKIPENEFTRQKKVTLRQLLSHSAGLTNHAVGTYGYGQKIPTLLEALDGKPPARPRPVFVDVVPGSQWRYSGGGYSVLQQLLIDVTGKPFPEFMNSAVLKPLGMTHSFYQQPLSKDLERFAASGHRFTGEVIAGKWMILPEMAAGGLWSTASDLALFVIELQKSNAGKSNKILPVPLTKEMLTPQISNMGLGVTIDGKARSLRLSHGDSNPGYRCYLMGYVETGQGAVIMTNSDLGDGLLQEIIRSIGAEYHWTDFQPAIRMVRRVNPKTYEQYVGVYEYAPGRTISITTQDARIFAQDNREFKSEVLPLSESKYFSILYNTEFIFVRGEGGKVVEIAARWAGDTSDTIAKKIK